MSTDNIVNKLKTTALLSKLWKFERNKKISLLAEATTKRSEAVRHLKKIESNINSLICSKTDKTINTSFNPTVEDYKLSYLNYWCDLKVKADKVYDEKELAYKDSLYAFVRSDVKKNLCHDRYKSLKAELLRTYRQNEMQDLSRETAPNEGDISDYYRP